MGRSVGGGNNALVMAGWGVVIGVLRNVMISITIFWFFFWLHVAKIYHGAFSVA
jgi:hypothetical protein